MEKHGQVTPKMQQAATEGIQLFEQMMSLGLNDTDKFASMMPRLVRDASRYYSTFTKVLGIGFEVDVKIAATREMHSISAEGGEHMNVRFANRKHYDLFMKLQADELLSNMEEKYF
jgi:hypothetical protein